MTVVGLLVVVVVLAAISTFAAVAAVAAIGMSAAAGRRKVAELEQRIERLERWAEGVSSPGLTEPEVPPLHEPPAPSDPHPHTAIGLGPGARP